MIKKKHKNIDPSEADCSFKYVCPECSNIHWLSLREVKTKNFKIVCECDAVLIPKRIKKIKTVFSKEFAVKKPKTVMIPLVPPAPKQSASLDIQNKCTETLKHFGYTENDIKKLLPQAIESVNTNYLKLIIDYLLKNLGDQKND